MVLLLTPFLPGPLLVSAAGGADSPLSWLTSLGAFVPAAAVLWYLYSDTRKDRDRYRDLVFALLPEYRDAMQRAATAQEHLAEMVEKRLLTEAEMVRLRRLLERANRARREEG